MSAAAPGLDAPVGDSKGKAWTAFDHPRERLEKEMKNSTKLLYGLGFATVLGVTTAFATVSSDDGTADAPEVLSRSLDEYVPFRPLLSIKFTTILIKVVT